MGEITTRVIGPDFAASSDEPTIEEQIASAEAGTDLREVVAAETLEAAGAPEAGEGGEVFELPQAETTAADRVLATYFESKPYIRVDANLEAGQLEGMILSFEEASALARSLIEAIDQATTSG